MPLITFARYFTQQKVLISKNSFLSLDTDPYNPYYVKSDAACYRLFDYGVLSNVRKDNYYHVQRMKLKTYELYTLIIAMPFKYIHNLHILV